MAVTLSTPERTIAQRFEALQRANDTRSRRASLKRDIRAGRVQFADLLASPPDYLRSAYVMDVLLCVPKVGRVKARAAFARAGISPHRTVGGITDRQRAQLLAELAGRV